MRRTLRLGLGALFAVGTLLMAGCGDSDLADCFADGAFTPLPGENTDESFTECIIDAGENFNLNGVEDANTLDESEEGDDDVDTADDDRDDAEEESTGEGNATTDVEGTDDDADTESEDEECESCEDDEEGEGEPTESESDEEADAD